jgi:hypothetical protein
MLKVLLKERRSSYFSAAAYENITKIANATGIPAAWIAGILKNESGGNCGARAFNNNKLKEITKRYGEDYEALVRDGLTKGTSATDSFPDGEKSYSDQRAGTNSYFHKAFKIAPKSAIAATAWGTYQVMGVELLRLAGGNPRKAKKMFFDDPCGTSFKLFVSWIKTKKTYKNGPAFLRAIDLALETGEKRYFADTVKAYTGSKDKDKMKKYINGVMKYSKRFQEQFQGSEMASAPPLEGNVYLLGDSNTRPHSKYWKAYVAKNFGTKVKVINRAVDGHSLKHMLKGLKNTKELVGVIVGSAGGNNVSAASMGKWSPEKIKSTLAPDSAYYLRAIVPLMSELSELQKQGAKVAFFGLPFGRGKGDECQNNTPLARGAMDEIIAYAAKQYKIPYYSVYKQTEKIKGLACGPHYNGDENEQAYRDALRSTNPAVAPAPKEELAYAKSISSGGKKIKISHNRFLRPYRYLQAAGIKFRELYEEFERVYGGDWEKKLLPKHRADYIFGPEHFAALKKYAKDTIHLPSSENLLALINKKNPSKKEPIIAKAEKAAEKKIEAVPPSSAGEPVTNDPKGVVADTIPVDDGDEFLSKIFGSFNESTGKGQKQKIRIILKS